MPPLPGFQNFIADDSETYDAIIPYESVLDSFQLAHQIIWEFSIAGGGPGQVGIVDPGALGMGISAGQGTGAFEIKLHDYNTGALAFWQKTTLTFSYTALSFGGLAGGGLDLFVWSFVKEKIETYVIGGAPTSIHPTTPDPNNPAWRHTIGGTELSEFGIAIPGGGPPSGNGVGINGGIIESFYQGPLYVNTYLPGGAGADIVRDQWQARITILPLWHIRAVAGDEYIDAYFSVFDTLHKAYRSGDAVYFSLAALPGLDQQRGRIALGREPSINEDSRGVVFAGVVDNDGVTEHRSDDTGHSWRPVRVPVSATDLSEVDLQVWSSGFNMARFLILPDGHRGTVVYKSGALWWKTSRDRYKGAILIAELGSQEAVNISVNAAGIYFVSTAGGQEWYSDNGGSTWKEWKPDETGGTTPA